MGFFVSLRVGFLFGTILLSLQANAGFLGFGFPSKEELALCAAEAAANRNREPTCASTSCSPFLRELHEDASSGGFIGWLTDTSPWRTCGVQQRVEDVGVSAEQLLQHFESSRWTSISPEFKQQLSTCDRALGEAPHKRKMLITKAYYGAARMSRAGESILRQLAEYDQLLNKPTLSGLNCSNLSDRTTSLCRSLEKCQSSDEVRAEYFREAEGLYDELTDLSKLQRQISRFAAPNRRGNPSPPDAKLFEALLGEPPPASVKQMGEIVRARIEVVKAANPLLGRSPLWPIPEYPPKGQAPFRDRMKQALELARAELEERYLQYQTMQNCFDPRFSNCEICSARRYRNLIEATEPLPDSIDFNSGSSVRIASQASDTLQAQQCVDDRVIDRTNTDWVAAEVAVGVIPVAGIGARLFGFANKSAQILRAATWMEGSQALANGINAFEQCTNTLRTQATAQQNMCTIQQAGVKLYQDYNRCLESTMNALGGAAPFALTGILRMAKYYRAKFHPPPNFPRLPPSGVIRTVDGLSVQNLDDIRANFLRSPTTEEELRNFNRLIESNSKEVKAVIVQENAVLKQMNDLRAFLNGDKDLATALSNLHHRIFLEIVEQNRSLKEAIVAIGTETKTNALALNTSDPMVLEGFRQALVESNNRFANLMNSGILGSIYQPTELRAGIARDPFNWFQAAIGSNFEEASQAARINRGRAVFGTTEVPTYGEVSGLLAERFSRLRSSQTQLQQMASQSFELRRFMTTGPNGQLVLSNRTVDVLRSTLGRYADRPTDEVFLRDMGEAFQRSFRFRPSDEQMLAMRDFYNFHNDLAPALVPSPRSLPDITQAVHGVVSFDRAQMGAMNIAEQMARTADARSYEDFIRQAREAERTVTREVQRWRDEATERSRQWLSGPTSRERMPSSAIGFSGEDGLAIPQRPIGEYELTGLMRTFLQDSRPAVSRLTFLEPRNMAGQAIPAADRSAWIQRAESLEKELRRAVAQMGVQSQFLDQTSILVRLTPASGGPNSLAGSRVEVMVGSRLSQRAQSDVVLRAVQQALERLRLQQGFQLVNPPQRVIGPTPQPRPSSIERRRPDQPAHAG